MSVRLTASKENRIENGETGKGRKSSWAQTFPDVMGKQKSSGEEHTLIFVSENHYPTMQLDPGFPSNRCRIPGHGFRSTQTPLVRFCQSFQ